MANPYTSSKPFLASARGRRKETSARIDFLWTWQSRRNSDEAAVRWRTRIVWTRKYSGYIAETKKSSASVGVNSRKVNKSKGIVFLSPLPRCKRSPPPPPPSFCPHPQLEWSMVILRLVKYYFSPWKFQDRWWRWLRSEYKNFMDGLRNLSEHVIVVILFFPLLFFLCFGRWNRRIIPVENEIKFPIARAIRRGG